MDGAIGKLVFVFVAVGGIAWGFSALVGQVGQDWAALKRQADALALAVDADQAERLGAELARKR